jgi:hypothetical protein
MADSRVPKKPGGTKDKPAKGGPNPAKPGGNKPKPKPEPIQGISEAWTIEELGPAPEGQEWVLTPGGGAALRPIPPKETGGDGTTEPTEPAGRPGAAWIWNGSTWTRPNKPSDGKPYLWDDNLGWQEDSALMASRTNASSYLRDLFKQFGFADADITNLMTTIDGWIQQGLADSGTEPVLMKFRDTDIYKRRFAGMAELIARGQAISEAEYIQLETSYRNVMSNYGIDPTYYDNYDDYARLIGAGLSPREVEERVVAAKQSMNPLVAAELREYFDVTEGDLTAYMLGLTDGKGLQLASARNQQEIRQGARLAQIGAAAERAGFSMDKAASERLAGTSIGQTLDPFQMETMSRLEGTFDQARRVADRETTLAGIDNETFDQRDALAAAFGDRQAQMASERRGKRERARFAGSGGASAGSLAVERNF